ncbi:hypothetical protein D9615_007218 [Tricholomella constricta]|uniref:Protein kinase domain-containing protein n=1 Tax=Tricholomella constricta TaxID=117010 RepID=A0A8H5H5C6_9AGAR|nr:hypothetical protein D9615_007218 [Tricholomella constricta]
MLNLPSPTLRNSEISTLPRLEIQSLDTSPFSDCFSGLIEEESMSQEGRVRTAYTDTSYDIEGFTNIKELDPFWDDEDVDEILVISPKTTRKLPTIEEEPAKTDGTKTTTMADFEPLPTLAESNQRDRLYRKRDTGRIYAFKIFQDCANLPSEQGILNVIKDMKAPFLPRIHWSFQEDLCLFVVIEYYSRKSLQDLVACEGPFRSEHARFYASEIVQALSSLHAVGIVHRDLSPEHITIDSAGHIIVEGFGSSELLRYPASSERGREPLFCTASVHTNSTFLAPELVLGWAHDFAVDCWGFGMLLRFMLSGKHLFSSDDITSVVWKDAIVHESVPMCPLLETSAQDLITKCLKQNPIARINLFAIRKHAYFSVVDWKKVAAKRIRVPHPFSLNPNTGTPRCLGLHANCAVSPAPRNDGRHSRKPSHFGSGLTTSITSSTDCVAPAVFEHAEALPKISRMSSLLDDFPDTLESTTSASDLAVHSALTLNDSPVDIHNLEINSRDRMALFWETLDLEQASISPAPSLDDVNTPPRPRKLRKSRSSIYPERRFSTLSTTSLQNKLRKKAPVNSVPLPLKDPSLPPQDLPDGVEQIGGGIGFTYNIPVAARSKESICTNTPQTCHGIFQGRLPGLGLGLRSANSVAKAKARRTLLSLVVPPAQEEPYDSTFPRNYRGSSWSLAMPLSPDLLNIESKSSATASSSPLTEAGPLTPATLAYEEPEVMMGEQGFEERFAHEVKVGDAEMTLRLVLPSRGEE